RPVTPRRLGPPALPPTLAVGEAIAFAIGHLGDVMHHYAAAIGAPGDDGEPVHQMRVALRRLRSALALFRPACGTADPALAEARDLLRALGGVHGPARDWHVFLAGGLRQAHAAFPEEPALLRLLDTAARRRREAYQAVRAFLDGAEFRRLGVVLACLAAAPAWLAPDAARPPGQQAALDSPLAEFAAHALARRRARLLSAGPDLGALPAAARHAARLNAKRLRYACELFAPLFDRRDSARMIRRLAALQDVLGRDNDTVVAAELLAGLGPIGRGHAAGLVRGHLAARSDAEEEDLAHAWRRVRRAEPFWS
ncbi:MAG: CHAD domain-containing protein, partial [Rhodospirillales bacterium]|nr:CHAD domain-containing protein [Rhodospirillales bacterium]